MVTVDVAGSPGVTSGGSVPNPRVTCSSSSCSASSLAWRLKVRSVSEASKRTLPGTPE